MRTNAQDSNEEATRPGLGNNAKDRCSMPLYKCGSNIAPPCDRNYTVANAKDGKGTEAVAAALAGTAAEGDKGAEAEAAAMAGLVAAAAAVVAEGDAAVGAEAKAEAAMKAYAVAMQILSFCTRQADDEQLVEACSIPGSTTISADGCSAMQGSIDKGLKVEQPNRRRRKNRK